MNGIKIEYPWVAEVQRAFNQPRNPDGTFASIGGGGSAGSKKTDSKKKAKVKLSQGEQLKKDLALAKSVVSKLSPEDQKTLKAFDKKISDAFKAGKATDVMHKDSSGNWTPERRKKQQEIEESFFANATPAEGKPRFIVTGGLPGSGKSTVLAARKKNGQGSDFDNVIHVDSDAIKGMLPEYEGWNAALLHAESREIASRIMKRAKDGGYNVVYDFTMKKADETSSIIDGFSGTHETKVVFVDIPLKSSMERAVARSLGDEKRYVPTDYIATHDSRNKESLEAVKGKVDSWEHWDNSQPWGEPPTLVANK